MSSPSVEDMIDAIDTCVRHDAFETPIDEWEENFFIDMQERKKKNLPFTPNMIKKLKQIYDKT